MQESLATVVLVDDDKQIRDALGWVLQSVGLRVESCGSPEQALAVCRSETPGCLVLDLQLPGMSGFELRKRLIANGCFHPFLIMSGHGDVSSAVRAMRMGAIDFLEKPFSHQRLVDCVHRAIQRDREDRLRQAEHQAVHERLDSLTPRESEVLELVADGTLSKRIATKLGISPKTVEVHRSNIMRKMKAESVAQLVHLVTRDSLLANNRALEASAS
jgi:two-component system, LuxR family, response regulator FixJ